MNRINKIIFVSKSGNCREVMAMELLKGQALWERVQVEARGLVVLMPEPVNRKAETVMISNGIVLGDFASQPLTEEDFADDTLIFTMENEEKQKILKQFEAARNVHVLTEATGDELEILNPYGGELIVYGLCFETLGKTIRKLASILNEEEYFCDERPVEIEPLEEAEEK